MSRFSTNTCTVHNPTGERLVLTVAIVGDVEQLGTRMASIGHQTCFPPDSTIIVTNLYWTTPGTLKKSANWKPGNGSSNRRASTPKER